MNPAATLTDLAAGLRAKDFSSVELTRNFLDRIERLDVHYNSFITVTANARSRRQPRRISGCTPATRPR